MKRIICTLLTLAIVCALGMCAFAEAALNAGDIVTFGTYPQTAYGGDDTPIEWIVLDVQEGRALLLSRYGLDVQKYNNEKADVTWESCTLRAWLNSDFMNRAFSEAEQDAIYLTDVDSSPEQCLDFQAVYGKENTAEGGNAVQDKVFLLSYAEANLYLGVDNTENTGARVEATKYAWNQGGASLYSQYPTSGGADSGWWWLRSPGMTQSEAAYVHPEGYAWSNSVSRKGGCVRPAVWVSAAYFE